MENKFSFKKVFTLLLAVIVTISSFNIVTTANAGENYFNDDITVNVSRYFTDEVDTLTLGFTASVKENAEVSDIKIARGDQNLISESDNQFIDKISSNDKYEYTVSYVTAESVSVVDSDGRENITVQQTEKRLDFVVDVNEIERIDEILEEEVVDEINGKDPNWDYEQLEEVSVEDIENASEPLAISYGVANVSTWTELQQAFGDSNVSTINLTDNIIRTGSITNNLPLLKRSLTINGNDFYIDFSGAFDSSIVLDSVKSETVLQLNDVKFDGFNTKENIFNEYVVRHKYNLGDPNSKHLDAKNWDIRLHNISTNNDSEQRGLVKVTDSKVTVTGYLNWNSSTTIHSELALSTSGVLVAKDFLFTDGARVNIKARKDILNSSPADIFAPISFVVEAGSVLNLDSKDRTAMWIGKEATFNPTTVNITGSGTEINATTDTFGQGQSRGVILFFGYGQKQASYVNIADGAQVNAKSTNSDSKSLFYGRSTPAVVSQIKYGDFTVTGENTKLNLESLGDDIIFGATFWMRISGDQKLTVSDQAEMTVRKVGTVSTVPAMRLFGGNNNIVVDSGGKLRVYNAGTNKQYDPSGDGRNQGIQFPISGFSEQTFKVSGPGSLIEIISENGPAIDIDGLGETLIEVSDQASFIAYGKTRTKSGAIIYANNVDFVADNPGYYDFANTREGGGRIFETHLAKSRYISINTDLALWNIGDDIKGAPFREWGAFNFTLGGLHFNKIITTSNPTEFNTSADSFGVKGMENKTRISGNNARPFVDEFYKAENANKSFFGHVSILDPVNGGYRDANTNEVYVELEIKEPNTPVKKVIVPTIGLSASEPGVSIYGETARGGIFVYEHGDFIVPGTTFEVTRAWRGDENPDNDKNHSSLPEDIATGVITATDVTPPIPVEIATDKFYEVDRELTGTWTLDGKHNDDEPSSIKVLVNGTEVLADYEINSNNTWKAVLDDSVVLDENDIVSIVLVDALGNENPLTSTDYHDAIFEGAASISVSKTEYVILAEDQIIGLNKARSITNEEELLDLIKAQAIYIPTSTNTPVKVLSTNFEAKAGTYIVKVAVQSNLNITKDVTVRVLDRDIVEVGKDYILAANNIYLTSKTAEIITDAEIIDQAQAVAYLIEDESITGNVRIIDNQIISDEGQYDVTFDVVEEPNLNATVTANVFANDIIVETAEYLIVANNFAINKEEAKNVTDLDIMNLSQAKGYLKSNLTEVMIELSNPHTIIGEEGIYPVSLNVVDNKDTKLEISVHVFEVVDNVAKVAWSGKDAMIKLADLSVDGIKDATNIKALDISDLSNIIEIDRNEIDVFNIPTETTGALGKVVTFAVVNNGIVSNHDQLVHVFDDIIIDPSTNSGFAINANDFESILSNVMSRRNVRNLAKVTVFEISENNVTVNDDLRDDVLVHPFPLFVGENSIDYMFISGNKAIVASKKALIAATNIELETKDAVIDLATAKNISEEQLKTLVIKSLGHEDPSVDINEIDVNINNDAITTLNNLKKADANGITVDLLATYTTDTKEVSAKVYVFDSLDNDVAWIANDFSISQQDSKDAYTIKTRSHVAAFIIGDVNDPAYSGPKKIDNANIKVNNFPEAKLPLGDDVTFSIENEKVKSTYTVKAFVFDSITPNPNGDEIAWTGKDYVTSLAKLGKTDEYFIEKNAIKAYKLVYDEGIFVGVEEISNISVDNKPTKVTSDFGQVVTYGALQTTHNQRFYVFKDIDDSNEDFIVAWNGKNGFLRLSELSREIVRERADVTAFNITDINNITQIDDSKIEMGEIPKGVAENGELVKFSTTEGKYTSNSEFRIFIFDDVETDNQANFFTAFSSGIELENGFGIVASNIKSPLSGVQTETQVRNLANVNIFEIIDSEVEFRPDLRHEVEVKPFPLSVGENDVSYYFYFGDKFIHADKKATITETDILLEMQNAVIDLKTAQNLTSTDLENLVIKSIAHNKVQMDPSDIEVKITNDSLKTLNELTQPSINGIGVDVEVSYKGDKTSGNAKVYVYNSISDGIAWNAKNFEISKENSENADLIKQLSKVEAFIIGDTTSEGYAGPVKVATGDINVVNYPEVNLPNGDDVKFSYDNAGMISTHAVKGFVFDSIIPNPDGHKIGWTGENYVTKLSDLQQSDEYFIASNKIKAYKLVYVEDELSHVETIENISVANKATGITSELGHSVTYSTESTSFARKFYVYNDVDETNPNYKVAWNGNDAFIKYSELSSEKVRKETNVTAFNVTDINNIVKIADENITMNNVPTGIAELGKVVDFSTTDGTYTSNHSQVVYVFDDIVIDPITKKGYAITAKDFTSVLANVKTIDQIKALADVRVFEIEDGNVTYNETLRSKVDVNPYPLKSGLNSVAYKFIEGNQVVTANKTAYINETDIELTMKNGIINLETANKISEEELTNLVIDSITHANGSVNRDEFTVTITNNATATLNALTKAESNGVNVEVEVTYLTDSTKGSAKVYVFDEIKSDVAWNANNIVINKANSSNDSALKQAANIEAYIFNANNVPEKVLDENIKVDNYPEVKLPEGDDVTFSLVNLPQSSKHTVKAFVFDNITPNPGEETIGWTGEDYATEINKLQNDDAYFISSNKIHAYKLITSDDEVVSVEEVYNIAVANKADKVTGKVGHPVQYSIGAAVHTQLFYVFEEIDETNPDFRVAWSGTDAIIKFADLSRDEVRAKTNVEALNITDINNIVKIDDSKIVMGEIPTTVVVEGVDVTFTTSEGKHTSNHTQLVRVFDDVIIDPSNKGYAIAASDFTSVMGNVSTETDVKNLAKVNVFEINDDTVEIKEELRADVLVTPFPLNEGVNNVTYTYNFNQNSVKSERIATISDTDIKLELRDAVINLNQAQNMTEAELKTLIVKSLSHADNSVDVNDLSVTITNDVVKQLNALTKPAVNGIEAQVKVQYKLDKTEATAKVYVYNSVKDGVAWNAENFVIEKADSKNDVEIKKQAKVEAFIIEDVNNPVFSGPRKVSDDNIKVDNYPEVVLPAGDDVTFSLVNEVKTSSHTVKSYVLDSIIPNPDGSKIGWIGEDYATQLADLEDSDEYFITKNKIEAYKFIFDNGTLISVEEIKDIKVSNKPTGLTGDAGQAVKYTAEDVDHTQKFYVFEKIDPTNPEFIVAWNGEDAFIKLAELTRDNVRVQTNVEAFDVTNPSEITKISESDITMGEIPQGITVTGQDVEFSTEKSGLISKTTQLVYVFDDVVVDPETKLGYAITAENFNSVISNVARMTQVLNAAKVNIYQIADDEVSLKDELRNDVLVSPFPLFIGSNDLTYTYTNGDIKVETIKNAMINETDLVLDMHDAVIDLKTANIISTEELKSLVIESVTHNDPSVSSENIIVSITNDAVYDLNNLTSPNIDGIPVEIEAEYYDDSTVKTAKVYVFDEVSKDVAWNANNFVINKVDSQNEAKIKQAANVKAYLIGDVMDPAYSGPKPIIDKNIKVNNYPEINLPQGDNVVFSLVNETVDSTHKVKAFVFDSIDPNPNEDSVGWLGEDYATSLAKLGKDDAYFIEKNKIQAFSLVFNEDIFEGVEEITEISVSNAPTKITAATGQSVIYGAKGSTHSQKFYVFKEVDESNDGFKVGWNGRNGFVRVSELTRENVRNVSRVQAFDITNINEINEIAQKDIIMGDIPTGIADSGEIVNFKTTLNNMTSSYNNLVFVFDDVSTSSSLRTSLLGEFDELSGYGITAKDFSSVVGKVKTAENVKKLAKVTIYDIVEGEVSINDAAVADVVVDPFPLSVGENAVSYSYQGNGDKIVSHKNASISKTDILLDARHATISLAKAKTINAEELKQLVIEKLSHVDGSVDINKIKVEITNDIIKVLNKLDKPTVTGLPVELSATYGDDSVTASVEVHVYDTVVNNVGWNANDFAITKELSTDDDAIKTAANVSAYILGDVNDDFYTGPKKVALENIKVNNYPTAILPAGDSVTFSLINEAVESDYSVTGYVFDAINPNTKEAMNANDFIVSLKDVSEQNYKDLSKVEAYDISDLGAIEKLPMSKISLVTPLAEQKGLYDVIFKTDKGTTITVVSTVFDKGGITPDGKEALYANDFEINLVDVNEENIKRLSGLLAFSIENGEYTLIDNSEMIIVTAIPNEVGVYDVTFRSPLGNEITVVMDVTTSTSIIAKDVTIGLAEFNTKRDDKTLESHIITKSEAKVYDEDSNVYVDGIKVSDESLAAIIPEAGKVYPVVLVYELVNTNEAESKKVTTTINLAIVEDEIEEPVTPEKPVEPGKTPPPTGIAANELASYSLLLISALGLVIISKKRKEI